MVPRQMRLKAVMLTASWMTMSWVTVMMRGARRQLSQMLRAVATVTAQVVTATVTTRCAETGAVYAVECDDG